MTEQFMWEKELGIILNDWKDGDDYPLDGDEVQALVNVLQSKLNVLEGNITYEEYLEGEH